MNMRMLLIVAVTLGLGSGLCACGMTSIPRPPTLQISIQNFKFVPAAASVVPGTRIVWINQDDAPHVIISDTGAFAASAVLNHGDRYAVTLTKPGEYAYHCGIHPYMQGNISIVMAQHAAQP